MLKEESWNPEDVNWKWLLSNLHFHHSVGANNSNWTCLFGILLWSIWKNQNLIIFQGNSMSPKDIISTSYSWANHFSSTQIIALDCRPNQSSTHQNSGGVIRDGRGQWILGYNRPLGKCTAVIAELWVILDGLLLVQKQGYAEVIIQSDNLENVIFICESKLDSPKSSLVRRIQQILSFEEKWSLNYVPRESNQVADTLVKMALTRSETLHMFEEPLLEIKGIMKEDYTFDNMSRK
ncbi:hypothetical protein J1N35_024651 [Gossypium stocksii]|uniref:RNase H type-1 domain-containing protein n=1 Tax=Gossypium stocksii TaxID=47602 RepID=A0A9D3V629_9ROSI|nr:hypothetical protein J1N35_024651 [Gossypium stocksii]